MNNLQVIEQLCEVCKTLSDIIRDQFSDQAQNDAYEAACKLYYEATGESMANDTPEDK